MRNRESSRNLSLIILTSKNCSTAEAISINSASNSISKVHSTGSSDDLASSNAWKITSYTSFISYRIALGLSSKNHHHRKIIEDLSNYCLSVMYLIHCYYGITLMLLSWSVLDSITSVLVDVLSLAFLLFFSLSEQWLQVACSCAGSLRCGLQNSIFLCYVTTATLLFTWFLKKRMW